MIETLQIIRNRLSQRPDELKKARESGVKVLGWSGYNIPEEIIYALGIIPIRIAIGGDEKLVEVGARYISTRNCVYVRELLGLIDEGKDPYIKNIDVYAFDATCLQTFRTAELVEFYFKKDVFVLGVPRNFYWDEAKEYFINEAKDFTAKLEEKTGLTLDAGKLEDAIRLYNKTRETLIRIYAYQASRNNVITWDEVYEIIQAGYFLDRKEYLSLLEQTLDELITLQENSAVTEDENEVRLFISGSIIPPGDRKLINIIKKLGGRIVGDDLWSGIIPYLDLNIEEPTIAGVALGYLNRTPHGALPYLDLQSDRRLKKMFELIDEFNAQGVIYHTLRYCDPYTFKAKETKDVLAKRKIPFLEIHTEYAGSDIEAIRTRIEAFLEMIQNTTTLQYEKVSL